MVYAGPSFPQSNSSSPLELLAYFERNGLRMFHKEGNWKYGQWFVLCREKLTHFPSLLIIHEILDFDALCLFKNQNTITCNIEYKNAYIML